MPERLWKWIDRRTGADRILRHSLDEPIPGGARFAYVFGSALLFIFLSQIVTGVCLALYYAPSPLTAHASVAYIVKEVAAGSFLRSLHSYGSSAMLVVLLLHFLQTFLYGSYKGRRELLWISGCTLSLLVLGMAFTGYLLSWDQSAYSAGSVGTDLVGQVPFIGESLRLLLRGGAMMGALTLSRFYVLHILIIPGLIVLLIAGHIALFRKAGAAGPVNEDPITPHLPAETFYPKQVLIDMTFVLLVMGVLGMLAHFVPVMLGLQADPANTRYLPRPEWYYLPMFQWLKYWQGARTIIGVFMIPGVLIGLLFSLPFMDRGRERRPWRRPIPVVGILIVLIGLVWLGMTSRLDDARDPNVAARLAEQKNQESVYFYTEFQPFTAVARSGGGVATSLGASASMGQGIFDSHGCSGCHGQSGGGAVGPALTHISTQYSPAQLTALLKAPTARMKAAGMVPLTLNAAEMTSLVSYLTSLGGTSAATAATPSPSTSSSAAPATAQAATAGPAKAGTGKPAADASTAPGKGIFDSHGCSGCHGQSGGGAVGPALTHISSQYPPAQLTALLKAPTARMKAAGMVPLTLNAADMKALVSYLASL
ncbi:MAG: cytochrome b N-terminal domain-containing protein, partial [Thermoanaerobaculia bacterium]